MLEIIARQSLAKSNSVGAAALSAGESGAACRGWNIAGRPVDKSKYG
jgi:hypothetical protein